MQGAGVASTDFPLRLKVLGLLLCCAPLSVFLLLDFDPLSVVGYAVLSLLLSLLAAGVLEARAGGFSPRRFVLRFCGCMALVVVLVLAYGPLVASLFGRLGGGFDCLFCPGR
jgi:hypothetical protein